MAPCALDESFTSFNFVLTKIKPVNNERAGASARGKPRQPLWRHKLKHLSKNSCYALQSRRRKYVRRGDSLGKMRCVSTETKRTPNPKLHSISKK